MRVIHEAVIPALKTMIERGGNLSTQKNLPTAKSCLEGGMSTKKYKCFEVVTGS